MVPTVLLLALALGRWWAVPVLAVAWALVLPGDDLIGAAALGAANAAVGVGARAALARSALGVRRARSAC